VMNALWTMERPEFRGHFFSFTGVRAEPRPLQRPHPPIIFGGKSVHAYSRVARIGDGWYGYSLDLAAAADCIRGIRAACAEHGRRFDEVEISVTPKTGLDRDLARRYAQLGVQRLILPPRGPAVTDVLDGIKAAERDLIGRV
jgi:alkanesulfonate monooxygenase SsuD/methylene tetrahydromethanopterin reductase-like flavin-dependent oxidoreductase (luciferase family)